MKTRLFLISCILLIHIYTFSAPPKRQMRGVWIATVTNLDWPSQKGLSSYSQKAEMIHILDKLKSNNINTVIFQARPSGDVFYDSDIETWSMFLSGVQGIAPQPYYDPLEFVISEAHKRCMDVHVWLNPYRALLYEEVSFFNKNHLFFKDKDLFLKYGDKYYFNPGLKKTQDHLVRIVKEIVNKYDIEAIHFDDYFYPYPIPGKQFPDYKTFTEQPRGFSNIADWRRDNINTIIKRLNKTIKETKPWVEFGISPFGVWRHKKDDPKGSSTYKSLTNYDNLYADILKWIEDGDIDYVVPQLYWEIKRENIDYRVLIDWWSENKHNTNLYIGLYASGFEEYKTNAWRTPNELIRQMELNKKNYPEISGEVFFRAKTFIKDHQGLNTILKNINYRYPALVPLNKNIQGQASAGPKTVKFITRNSRNILTWEHISEKGGKNISYYIIYAFKGNKIGEIDDPRNIVTMVNGNGSEVDLTNYCSKLSGIYSFVVTSVNKYKQESKVKTYVIKRF